MYEKIVLKNALKSVQKYYFTFESLYFSTLIVKYLINNGIFIIQTRNFLSSPTFIQFHSQKVLIFVLLISCSKTSDSDHWAEFFKYRFQCNLSTCFSDSRPSQKSTKDSLCGNLKGLFSLSNLSLWDNLKHLGTC